jgi:hypothetical protein
MRLVPLPPVRGFRLIVLAAAVATSLGTFATAASSDTAKKPKQAECGHPEYISQLEVVFGRTKTLAAANKLRTRVVAAGFANADVIPECRGYKVSVRGAESFDVAVDLQSEARHARFAATIECIKGKDDVGELEAVFGHRRDRASASDLVARATSFGFTGLQLESDPCGGYEVMVKGFASRAQADDFVAEANRAGFNVVIEKS